MSEKFEIFIHAVRQINGVRSGLISIDLVPQGEGVELVSIWSEKERGQGHASRAMRALLEIADEFEMDIVGQPHWLSYDTALHEDSDSFSPEEIDAMDRLDAQKLDNQQLLKWYQRLGFELTGRQMGDDSEIIRRANSPLLGAGRSS